MISKHGRGSTGLSGKWVGRHLSGEPKFDIPFSVFFCCPVLYDFQLRRCVLQTFLDFDSTERLLDAVVPFIALRPRIESMWKHGVHTRGKDTIFRRNFCVLPFSFAESHYWYTDSYPHKHPKNSWKFLWHQTWVKHNLALQKGRTVRLILQ